MEVSAWQWSTTKLIAFEYNFHTGLRLSDIGPTAFHLGWVQFIALHLSIILLADGRPPPPNFLFNSYNEVFLVNSTQATLQYIYNTKDCL